MKIGNRMIVIVIVIIAFFVSSIVYYELGVKNAIYISFCIVRVDSTTCQNQNLQVKVSTYARPHEDPLEDLLVLIDDTKVSGTWERNSLEKVNPDSWLYGYTLYPNVSLRSGIHSLQVIGSCGSDKEMFQC